METLTDLVARTLEFGGTAIEIQGRTAPYTYGDFAPNVWKSGNLLGHYGVHPGADVTVLAEPKTEGGSGPLDAADPVFAALGATLLGSSVGLVPVEPVEDRAFVLPSHRLDAYETAPSCTLVAYGAAPSDPSVVHFEAEMWSENPIEPPESVDPDDPAFRTAEETFTHRQVIAVAETLEDEYSLGPDATVVLDTSLTDPGAFVGGVLAPVAAGATLLVPDQSPVEVPALTVTAEGPSGEGAISPASVTERLRDTRRA